MNQAPVAYQYYNRLAQGDNPLGANVWTASENAVAYLWQGNAPVTDQQGVDGQNSANPHSIFPNHALLDIGGTIYDPSYGRLYQSLQNFEDTAIVGFATPATVTELVLAMALRAQQNNININVDIDGDGVPNEQDEQRLLLIRRNPQGQDTI